ncbi:MAG: DUF934 domain-containing protein [Burkholderiaceae bacterium]|nr:DUF934 domain-containing protein [Burkholderiaceae bacterium]
MKLIAAQATNTPANPENSTQNLVKNDSGVIAIANDVNPLDVSLAGVTRIDLNFPKFTDGRAFSQAVMLRKRAGFTGEIRATGDVLVDQLQQMARSGFDVAELRADQDLAAGQRQLDRYAAFYQGDVVHTAPHFVKQTEKATA